MTDLPGSIPQRIGDRERDQAAEYLRDHLAEGRLDQLEFDERLTGALTAKTQADLDPLFVDLPNPKPSMAAVSPFVARPLAQKDLGPRGPYPVRLQSRPGTALAVASALIWPAMIVLMIASNGHFLWIMFLPFLLPWVLGQGNRHNSRRR